MENTGILRNEKKKEEEKLFWDQNAMYKYISFALTLATTGHLMSHDLAFHGSNLANLAGS
jgi:hypothetical protein